MGWLYMSYMDGFSTPKAYLDNQFTFSNDQGNSKVLKSSMVGKTYYAAVEQILHLDDGDKKRDVFALICLTNHTPSGGRDGLVFGYKDMTERMGPVEAQCPVSILDLLMPTTSEYALEWREKCRAYAAKQKAIRAMPKLAEGQRIEFKKPVTFTDGTKHSRFLTTRLPRKRGLVFQALDNGRFYRISKVNEMQFSVIA